MKNRLKKCEWMIDSSGNKKTSHEVISRALHDDIIKHEKNRVRHS